MEGRVFSWSVWRLFWGSKWSSCIPYFTHYNVSHWCRKYIFFKVTPLSKIFVQCSQDMFNYVLRIVASFERFSRHRNLKYLNHLQSIISYQCSVLMSAIFLVLVRLPFWSASKVQPKQSWSKEIWVNMIQSDIWVRALTFLRPPHHWCFSGQLRATWTSEWETLMVPQPARKWQCLLMMLICP